MLRRLLAYGEKILAVGEQLDGLQDGRCRPRIATGVVARSLLAMALARLGSLNALEHTRLSRFWAGWLRAALPSADSLGRIPEQMEPEALRQIQAETYRRLKRNKALPATAGGLVALVLDGHESHASYRQHCAGCCQRIVQTAQGPRAQFFHRHVAALLLGGDFPLWLDVEPQQPGEDEIAAAVRLVSRLLDQYPRAFDVVLGDAAYTDPRLYNLVRGPGKDLLTVLKRDVPNLLADAEGLFAQLEPIPLDERCLLWEASGFTTWPQVQAPVRVIRTHETRTVRRQLTGERELCSTEWVWVTTLSVHRAPAAVVVRLGHARWEIENQGFNEIVTRWHADHLYRHHPTAILIFTLLTLLAVNLFFAFYHRNLQLPRHQRLTPLDVARCLASEIYHSLQLPLPRPP